MAPFRKLGGQKRDLRRPQNCNSPGRQRFHFPGAGGVKMVMGPSAVSSEERYCLAWGAGILRMDS